MREMVLLPRPQTLAWKTGELPLTWRPPLTAGLPEALVNLAGLFPDWPGVPLRTECVSGLDREGYALSVTPTGAVLRYSAPAGAYYGLVTLEQLLTQCPDALPCCEIQDAPALPNRGVLLDVSRGKVPKLETLFHLADLFSRLKYNHLELYLEGFSFAYPSFPAYVREDHALTPGELRSLDAYCAERFIELVPNQNCLGHMAPWLAQEPFRGLAERPEGLEVMGLVFPPTTLDPDDPGSIALVERMTADLLPNFTSCQFNVDLDEPFELGQGKHAGADVGQVYLNYVNRMHDLTASYGKRMLLWGDVAARHAEILDALPEDVTLLEWGYEAEYPFDARCAALAAAGRDFWVCPGTSSWNTCGGLTDNMLGNVAAAAGAGYVHGASGLLMTDWGDNGHLQYLSVSYPGFACAAAFAWNPAGVGEGELAAYLDRILFRDGAGELGKTLLELGRYARFEEYRLPCRTLAATAPLLAAFPPERRGAFLERFTEYLYATLPPETAAPYRAGYEARRPLDLEGLEQFSDGLLSSLVRSAPACADGALICREAENTILLIRTLECCRAGRPDPEGMEAYLQIHPALWTARNKPGGLTEGLAPLKRLL